MAKHGKAIGGPAFVYFSTCCNERADKPTCEMPKGKGIGQYVGAKTEGDATLGKWHCGKCGRKCKVTRAVRQDTPTITKGQEIK